MANLNLLQERISSLMEDEIRKCYIEITEYKRVGTLPNEALVRQIRNEYAKELDSDSWDSMCYFTATDIMFEIAKRHYDAVQELEDRLNKTQEEQLE